MLKYLKYIKIPKFFFGYFGLGLDLGLGIYQNPNPKPYKYPTDYSKVSNYPCLTIILDAPKDDLFVRCFCIPSRAISSFYTELKRT